MDGTAVARSAGSCLRPCPVRRPVPQVDHDVIVRLVGPRGVDVAIVRGDPDDPIWRDEPQLDLLRALLGPTRLYVSIGSRHTHVRERARAALWAHEGQEISTRFTQLDWTPVPATGSDPPQPPPARTSAAAKWLSIDVAVALVVIRGRRSGHLRVGEFRVEDATSPVQILTCARVPFAGAPRP
jgi:hypothetical protein